MHNALVDSVRNAYGSTNVTTGAWVQLIASLAGNVRMVQIFDNSGATLQLGYGPSGSETRALIIVPNQSSNEPCLLSAGMRIAVKAISGTASTGELNINFFY